MSSKSRLGKGLGALFPALPGESKHHSQPELDDIAEPKSKAESKPTPKKKPAETSPVTSAAKPKAKEKSDAKPVPAASSETAAKPEPTTSETKSTEQSAAPEATTTAAVKSDDDVTAKTGEIARPAIPSMRDSVPDLSTPTAASTAGATGGHKESGSKRKRVAMPSLGDMAHPSDMFFGGSDAMDSVSQKIEANGGVAVPAKSESSSKERTDSKPAADGEKNAEKKELELKPVSGGYLIEVAVNDIVPNAQQPRTVFDEEELSELSASIKEVGVLQPIVVRKYAAQSVKHDAEQQIVSRETSPKYELIMGERRWRASQLAGLKTIPAIVKTTADDEMLRDALLENLHRVALNPLEEAAAYQQMIDEFGLTQAQLSKSVSKSRPQIANTLRLLNLPASVQKKVAAGVLSAGHARALLGLNDESQIDKLATRIIAEGLSVRSTEEIVAMQNAASDVPKKPRAAKNNPWAGSPIVNNLENHFDTKVAIKGSQQHGRIEIVFSSPEDMERILSMLIPTGQQPPQPGAQWV
ncbi:ParB/RepB/Spo0J family partition protein [Bifidobacterium leontopitheci]|uniref:Chromosome partitioning protein ParB n=1 Tax=Bifidobacterium leontopitheci TaxID=2650774 RepID=A0A6I1GAM4_9BIFI|nr:ParB/RepB/Spo0J family partition protein [Bifidobacterium leontopitheci]KAB7788704.1 chromosome partitioning protein ParB [Bifidobacterium leontopitheci]